MSGVLDFLFEGRPPPTSTNYGQTVTDMPKWLSDYTTSLVANAGAVAGQPYQAYEGPRLAGLTPDQLNAFDITRNSSGAYNPLMTGATNAAQGALTTAQPYLDKAGQSFPDQASRYMDPYVSNVIDRAGTLANRQLNEKFLPSVQGVFGSAGQDARSTGMRQVVDRGVRDLTEGLNEQALGALSGAYTTAGQQFNADAARQGALAQTAGNLSLDQARTESDLATTNQSLALRDAAAQENIGQTQQADTQRSLDLAYGDFQAQRDYPKSGLDWLSSILGSTPTGRSMTTSSTGPATSAGPTGVQQIGSIATGLAGLMQMMGGNKKAPSTSGVPGSGYMKRGGRVGGLRYRYGA